MMKTIGLIPDVLTNGEKFDIGPGSQRNYRTLLSWFNSGDSRSCSAKYTHPTATTGMSMFGKMSVGVVRMQQG
jgi:hypothetical protein